MLLVQFLSVHRQVFILLIKTEQMSKNQSFLFSFFNSRKQKAIRKLNLFLWPSFNRKAEREKRNMMVPKG